MIGLKVVPGKSVGVEFDGSFSTATTFEGKRCMPRFAWDSDPLLRAFESSCIPSENNRGSVGVADFDLAFVDRLLATAGLRSDEEYRVFRVADDKQAPWKLYSGTRTWFFDLAGNIVHQG